jgi:single-strand DNA-binding protein
MGSLNKAILIGNLGRDAEIRFTAGGQAVSNFSIATTEKWTDKSSGEKKETTEWHRVVLWGKTAEALQEYLTKGKQIYVEGRLQTREWTNKEQQKVKTTEIVADKVVLLGSGGGGGAEGRSGGGRPMRDRPSEPVDTGSADTGHVDPPADDDIPF